MKIGSITYPTRKKWLRQYWQKNVNIFLYALENEEIKKEIKDFRKMWFEGKIATDSDELEEILKEMFLKESLINKSEEEKNKLSIAFEGGKYYAIFSKGKMKAKYEVSNPFSLTDRNMGVPQAKLELIKILSSVGEKEYKEYNWIFEPHLFLEDEHKRVYPSKNIITATLHRLEFLRRLDYHILNRIKAEYFSLWPMFFYFALTDNIEFVLKNTVNLIYPVRAYLVEDTLATGGDALTFRIYGDCNADEIINFFKDNKKNIDKLNKILGNKNVSSRSTEDFNYYIESKYRKGEELAREIAIKDIKKHTSSLYEEIRIKSEIQSGNKKIDSKMLRKPLNRIRVANSQIKKNIKKIAEIKSIGEYKEMENLINKINTPILQ